MKWLGNIANVLLIVILIGGAWMLFSALRDCSRIESSTMITVPDDSSFAPVAKRTYRPPSTPFEEPSKPVQRLPKGVSEKDVKRVIRVVKTPTNYSGKIPVPDTSIFIETKSGQIFVPKQDSLETSVVEFEYRPPILDWGLFLSAGATLPGKPFISPTFALAPLQVYETMQIPLMAADLEGVGIGGGLRYRFLLIGLMSHWRFLDAGRQIKLTVHYAFN